MIRAFKLHASVKLEIQLQTSCLNAFFLISLQDENNGYKTENTVEPSMDTSASGN